MARITSINLPPCGRFVMRLLMALAVVLGVAGGTHAYAEEHTQQSAPCAVAAATALAQRGSPYVWGAKGPTSFDCSGLIYYAWTQAGYDVGLSTYDQSRMGVQIACNLDDLDGTATSCWQAGDLIFLKYTGGQHVAMYIGDGLFADAYNSAVGVIVHNPAADDYYWTHYWQSRRIVACDGVTVDPGAPSPPIASSNPGLEDLPDLLAPVSFTVGQCGDCNEDGSTLLPTSEWDGNWPSNPLDLAAMFQSAISWLAWRISELLRILICWLLMMLAWVASFLAALANVIVAGINGIWRLMLLFWFAFQAWMSALYYLIEDLVGAAYAIRDGVVWLIDLILLLIGIAGDMLGMTLSQIAMLAELIFGALGWIVGISVGMLSQIATAMGGADVPVQLSDTNEVYRALRGFLEGIQASALGWVLLLFWGAAYVGFVYWLTRFLSSSSMRTE